ncbi:hypothetical protein [Streptosporangium sp. NPDC049644]|uniref:hypothetical protein n=1 Tax=Streptosporangium sp. NPDC049644 TaxID=3155507 RepID=UPI003420AF35
MVGTPIAWLARVPVVVAGRRSLSVFKRVRYGSYPLERVATRLTRHVVANAVAVAEDARRVENLPHEKLSVIYNSLPDSAFLPAAPTRIQKMGWWRGFDGRLTLGATSLWTGETVMEELSSGYGTPGFQASSVDFPIRAAGWSPAHSAPPR